LNLVTSPKTAESWPRVRLGDVADARLGKMLDANKNKGRLRPYLANPSIRWFDVDVSQLKEMRFEDSEEEKFSIRDGDVLICEGGEAGRAAIWIGPDAGIKFQKAIHRVRTGPKLLNRFLVHRLFYDYHAGNLADYHTGATIKHLTGQDLARYEIPLPPLAEQRRIAAILDQADALRRKRREALDQIGKIEAPLFVDFFGGLHGKNWLWPVVPVGDAGRVQLGRQRAPKYQTGKYSRPYVRVANVYENRIDLSDVLEMDFDVKDFKQYKLFTGDVLLNEGQSTELVGRPAIWGDEIEDCCFQNTLIRFQADRSRVLPRFALAVFLTYFRAGEFSKLSSKTSSVAHLGASRLATMPFPVPTLEVQQAFLARVAEIDKLKTAHHAHLEKLDALFAVLQHRAFRGELTGAAQALKEFA
jgi:type I restriction enzyme S subunit